MSFATKNAEILALFAATGKPVPTEDSNMGRAVSILTTICDSQNHTVPSVADYGNVTGEAAEEIESDASDIFEALEEIETKIHEGDYDFTLDFDGNEYRIISDSSIWEIYVEEIKNTVEDCYELNLDKIPKFIAVSIDWELTAKNAYADGYGHQFSSYDGSENEAGGYYIFRTN